MSERARTHTGRIRAVGVSVAETSRKDAIVSVSETSRDGLIVAYRPLRDLIPYARNARTHSTSQIALIRSSLAHFGWTNPMLIAGNVMIAGHARLRAALEMANDGEAIPRNADPWSGPTIDLSHLSPEDRKAYVVTDNRSAELAGWDRDLLRVDMSELRLAGFDLSLTGFTDLQVDVILGGNTKPDADDDADDRTLQPHEQHILDAAWRALMDEWATRVEAVHEGTAILSTSFTPAALAVHFVRALLYGGEIPRGATFAYQPSRLFVNAHQLPLSDVFRAAIDNPALLESVRWQCQRRPLWDKFISASLGIHGHRAPNDFPAHLARDLINEFCTSPGASVLDPCHGWGGRLLGFLLADHAASYHGIDVNGLAQRGVADMYNDLRPFCMTDKSCKLDLVPFQEAELPPDSYDFALTSPPYFNVEKYDGERQSWREFTTFDEWVTGFYRPLITRTAAALKPGGCFALQVGSQMFPLTQLAKQIAGEANLIVAAIRSTEMTNAQMQTDVAVGEVVVILQKPGGSSTHPPLRPYAEPERPPGYLDHLDGVYVRNLTSGEEVRKALHVRQAYAGKELRPMPAVVYHSAADEGRMWGAFDANTHEIIGYATVRWRKRDNSCEFQQIGVNEDAPKGTGRLLSTVRWNYAVNRGATSCTLNTLITSDRARMYHAKFGFVEERREGKNVYFRMNLSEPQ